jgi:hypothetical protein
VRGAGLCIDDLLLFLLILRLVIFLFIIQPHTFLPQSYSVSRNDLIFNKQEGTNFMQVIRRASHWIQQWADLLPENQCEAMDIGCNHLLTVTRDFYFRATGILVGFIMDSYMLLLILEGLIHVSTLIDS